MRPLAPSVTSQLSGMRTPVAETALGELARLLLPLSMPADITSAGCGLISRRLATANTEFRDPGAMALSEATRLSAGQMLMTDAAGVAALAIPLLRDGRLVQVCCLRHAGPHVWTDGEMQIARDIAQWTWTAADNARCQAELRAERDLCHYQFEHLPDGFAIIDANWRVLQMNAAGLLCGRRTADQVIGRNHWDVWPEMVGSEMQAVYEHVKATGEAASLKQDVTFETGERALFDIDVQRIPGGSLAILFRDITRSEHAALALRDSDRRKDEFFGLLAHELRNPLAPITMAAELLKHPQIDAASVRNAGAMIQRQARHMSALLADLLDVSRINLGLVTLDMRPVWLNEALQDAIEQTRPLMLRKNQVFTLVLPMNEPRIMGDASRLVQIFANLLNNASKYTPAGGAIAMQVDSEGSQATVTVTDTGEGIGEELLPHVFDIFRQAERSPDREAGGLGLGLALVRNLVALQGGSVTAHSDGPGQGSRFVVGFPLLAATGAPRVDAPAGDAACTRA